MRDLRLIPKFNEAVKESQCELDVLFAPNIFPYPIADRSKGKPQA
jgi:hypothetical protein